MRAKQEADPSRKLAAETRIALMRLSVDALARGDKQAFRNIQDSLIAATTDVEPLPIPELFDIFGLELEENGTIDPAKVLNACLTFDEKPKFQKLNPDEKIRARASLYRLEEAIHDVISNRK